jgi:DNA (cytosine-5)-methyltransferase 1
MENIKEFTTIDLFAGCGGLSKGFEEAGFRTKGFIEIWDPAVETFKENFKNTAFIGGDITKIKEKNLEQYKNKIDVIMGGPPCQGFSIAGKRDIKDPRNSLFMDFVRVVSIVKPKMFLLENVRGMASMETAKHQKVVDVIIKEFKKIGYETKFKVLNVANYGIPQFRHRIIFIGVKGNINDFEFPKITHTEQGDNGTLKYNTVRSAIGDLESLKSGQKSKTDLMHFALNHAKRHIQWLSATPEGKSAHENKDPKLRPPSGYPTTYKRFWWDKPAPTVTTCFSSISSQNNVHPSDTRAITIREAARLQTFPDNFIFKNSISSIRRQIGNAVPPEFSRILAEKIKDYLIKQI